MSDRDVAFDATVATPGSGVRDSVRSATKDRHQELAEQFVGQVLGDRYELKRIVGAGGFGAVFESEDRRIKKRVAVKLLFADLLRDREAVVRFKLEAEAASRVGHRNIIDITDFDFTDENVAYMVMEFLEGEDLAHIIRRAETPDLARVVRICLQACRGLGAAHRKGIVHRDLKPGNIFVRCVEGEPEQVKVVDFGISRASELDEENEERLTKTGQILGTPYYMAPEQADGIREVDGRTDIYAMGVILFEGVTGRLPFMARTPIGLITKHASETPPSPREINPKVQPLLENTILKALEKEPEHRFKDMAEMEQALLGCLATLDPTAAAVEMANATPSADSEDRVLSEEALIALTTPSSILKRTTLVAPPPGRNRLVAIIAVAVLAVVVGVGLTVWALRGHGDNGSQEARTMADHHRDPSVEPRERHPPPEMRRAAAMTEPRRLEPDLRPRTPPRPVMVTIQCHTHPKEVRVTDKSGDVAYGVCPGSFTIKKGLKPVTVVLRHTGYIPQKVEVLPDRNKRLPTRRLTPLRSRPRSGVIPDDVITQ